MNCSCSPHNWKRPLPGDTALLCLDCGRELDRSEDITPNMRAAIVNCVQVHRYGDLNYFRGFFGYGPMADQYDHEHKPLDAPHKATLPKRKPRQAR